MEYFNHETFSSRAQSWLAISLIWFLNSLMTSGDKMGLEGGESEEGEEVDRASR
jgi:hypothetical protein